MSYISELEELLARNISDTSYVFDRRSITDWLTFMQDYTALVPFSDDKAWSDFFFRQTDKKILPSKLAGLYENNSGSNGLMSPEQAFMLAFFAMLETPRALFNHLPAMHKDLYYRSFLQLQPNAPKASQVVLEFIIDDSVNELLISAGTLMDAGQDSGGNIVNFALDKDLLANHCRWTDLNWTVKQDSDSDPYSKQVYSITDNISWPKGGVRLFEKDDQSSSSLSTHNVLDADDSYVGSTLYIGFDSIDLGQDINLFWYLKPAGQFTVSWEYLAESDTWKSINALVEENTKGWSESKDWKAVLPKDAINTSTAMPTGRYWIRARTTYSTENPWLINLYTNAMSATLQNAQNLATDFFDQPLPASTITDPVTNILDLASVKQLFPSYGGMPRESDQDFHQRIAHQLRHRDRASTWQDMQDLLLDNFSEIYSVQTPQQNQKVHSEKQVVIVLPRGGEMDNDDVLRPIFNQARLAKMSDFLQARASLWTDIVVSNATYIEVKATYDVIFEEGLNPDYGYHRLQIDLTNIYMPWVTNNTVSPVTGNRIDYYKLMSDMLRLSYVKQVSNLKLNDDTFSVEADDNQVLILNLPDSSTTNTEGT